MHSGVRSLGANRGFLPTMTSGGAGGGVEELAEADEVAGANADEPAAAAEGAKLVEDPAAAEEEEAPASA